jgi:hypothetical protein
MADVSPSTSPAPRSRRSRNRAPVKNGVTVVYLQERESKNFMRYEEEVENGKEAIVGSYFYISKALFDRLGKPEAIEMQLKPTE